MKHFRFQKAAYVAASFVAFAFCTSLQAQQHPLQVKHVPDAVRNGQASAVGQFETERQLHLVISLPLRNEDALDTLLQQIYDPQSPNFHRYLTPQQFTDSFGPSQLDYDVLVAWAKAKGLQVTATTVNRRLIEVDAPVSAINRAFNVLLKTYQDNGNARTFHAPDREPTVDVAVPLLSISGLDDANPPHSHLKKGDRLVPASSTITEKLNAIENITGSGPGNTYLPSDMRAAYYGSGPLNGAGQTVAIFSFDDYIVGDLNVYYTHTGMTSTVPVNNIHVNGYNTPCFGFNTNGTINPNTCDDGEQILDIVNVIGMAPGLAHVEFYVGNSASAVLNQMAIDNTASVISSSWGGGDFGTASDIYFKEFQAQGQTYLNATGDFGQFNSSTYDPPSVDANITQVGGTDLVTTGAAGPWVSETGWADSGGGFFTGTAIPAYQLLTGVINSTNQGSISLRNAPDVAAEANFDNTTVINGTFSSGYGGTSFAAPRWAGYIALANQQSIANGHGRIGFLNPTIYNIGVGSNYAANFHDITSGHNSPGAGAGSGFNAVAGYDLVTGWGSPNGPALITTLTGTASSDYSLSAAPNPITIVQGSNGTTTVTVTDIAGFTGAVALSATLPTGVTASFSPTSTTGTSVLTFTVAASAPTGSKAVTITGISGSLTHTANLSLNIVAAPDYSLSALPVSVVQGTSGTSTITVTPLNSFTGSVALSASGLPAGVTASFSPASATTSSALTLTASSTATLGLATVTITGTSGSLTHTTTVALTVVPPPDYSLSASPVSVVQGASGTSTIAVTAFNNFAGSVALSASGLPAGVTASFSPASTTTSSVLTLTASSTATLGPATVTITGTSGSLTHTTTVSLTVTAAPDYSLSGSPVSVVQGASGTSTITVTALNSFAGSVALSATGLPSGVTASFSPATATTSSVLTLTASSTAAVGSATVTITGTSGSLTHTTTVALTVTAAPDYSLSGSPVSVVQGASGTSTITVTALNSFAGSVALSATGLPSGVTASFSPTSATTSSILTLTASSTAAVGAATITITGTSGSLTHTTTLVLTVTATPDYSLSALPVSVAPGGSATSAVAVTDIAGFNGAVSLSASGLPTGVTASFSPSSTTTSSTLTLTASSVAAVGTAPITITGTSGSLTHTTTLVLTVAPSQDFTVSTTLPSMTLMQGTAVGRTVVITDLNHFSGSVGLSASGLPDGVTASFSPATATTSSVLTLTASSAAAVGPATITITGTSGGLTHTSTIALTVTGAPDYVLTPSLGNLTLGQGSKATDTITVVGSNGFAKGVSLSISGLPAGVTASFNPSFTLTESTLTLTASSTATLGPATITISGVSSGTSTHIATITLNATNSQDYSLSASAVSVVQGTSGTSTVTVAGINGFSGSVALSASGLPAGVTASFSPASATTSSVLTLTASSTASVGPATVTITGTSGSLTHTATVALTVTAAADYSLSASAVSVVQGASGTSTVAVTGLNGFSGSVALSASGLPAGVTASFNPATATTSSVLTLTASSTASVGPATVTITGTSGSLTHTATVALTVTAAADYSLSASAVSVVQGTSGTSTVTVAGINGFSGSVALSASGLPAGVTASFSPATATTSSVLTLTASSTASVGPATITITGTSGTLTHTTTVALTVIPAPDYSLSASSVSVVQGASGTSTITIAALNNFTGSVALSAAGLPTGVTASFSPASATTTSVLTLTASSTATVGPATITITGTSDSLTHTATLVLTVTPAPDYSLSSSPVSVVQGASGTSTITVTALNSFGGSVALSASGLPAGVTASFSPASATTTSTLTLTASSTATVGPATVTITGTSGSLTHTATLALTVTAAPDYSLSASAVSVVPGGSGVSAITVTSINNFAGSVALSASGLPSGVTASFSPATATTSSVLTLTASSTATVGPATITINGISGSMARTTTLVLTVQDYSLSASSIVLGQGDSATSTVAVTDISGFSGSVNLSVGGLPAGVTASFSPSSTTGGSVLTLTASSTATLGPATITISGLSNGLMHAIAVPLTVVAAGEDFTVSTTLPSMTLMQGTAGGRSVVITDLNHFNGLVNLSISGLPAGVTASFSPASTTGNSSLTLTASSTASVGTATVTITGTSGSLTHSCTLALTITGAPDYVLTPSLSSLTLGQGSKATDTITVVGSNGFAKGVSLSISGLPTGVTASFNPAFTLTGSTLTLTASSTATLGPATITISGAASGTSTHIATITLNVTTPQ